MSNKDLYGELAGMVDSTDITGIPMRPECLKIFRLLYTPSEARLALQIGLSGGTLDQLCQKTATDKAKLKEILHAMANKGTIIYDPAKDDPTYRVVGGAVTPGWVDAALWGNIRFPYSVELGKELYVVLNEWLSRRLSKITELGYPGWARVWAATAALPGDALPSENIAEVIKKKGSWSVTACPCRLSHWLAKPGEHCSHMLEVCMQTGEISRWCVEHGMARQLTYDQAVELLRKCEQDGLVHTSDDMDYGILCNCCKDCCTVMVARSRFGGQPHAPSPFMSQVDKEMCNACGVCVESCPVGAIEVDEFANVNSQSCLGCGVCIPACSVDAVALVRRPAAEHTRAKA